MHTDETDGSQPVLKIAGEALPSVSEISLLNDRTSPSLGRTNKAENGLEARSFSYCSSTQVSFAWKSWKGKMCRQLGGGCPEQGKLKGNRVLN